MVAFKASARAMRAKARAFLDYPLGRHRDALEDAIITFERADRALEHAPPPG